MLQVFVSILLIIGLNFVLQRLGSKIKIPAMVVAILIGLLIHIPVIHDFVLFNGGAETIDTLGEVGLIALMFVAGLGSSIQKLKKESHPATMISLLALSIPLIVGILVVKMLGYSRTASLICGIALSITAEATTAKTLFDAKKLTSKVGAAMLEAGIIDDIIWLCFFVGVGVFLNNVSTVDYLLIFMSIAAFFVWAFIKKHLWRKHHGVDKLERWLNAIIIPFLFVNIGIHFDFSAIWGNLWILIIVLALAFSTKILGSFLAKSFTSFNWRQILLIWWAMNSRGAVGLAIILVASQLNVLPGELYSALVITALLTTLVFPFAFQYMLQRNPRIMEE
jgi:Kef-type K+ transport system membrane component KefB